MKSKVLGLLLAGLLTGSMSAGAVVISNSPTGGNIAAFGVPDSRTYGQVFTAPITGILDSFTLYLDGGVGALFGGVGTWNGTATYGTGFGSPTNLYESAVVNSPAAGPYTFTPNISVIANQRYVAYLSAFNVVGANSSTSMPLGNNSDTNINYFVWNNATDPRNNAAWNYFFDAGEARFSASFSASAVPEPASLALLGLGLAGLGFMRRRRT